MLSYLLYFIFLILYYCSIFFVWVSTDTSRASPFLAGVFTRLTLFALQQLSGINAVFFSFSTVFKGAGVPSDLANVCIGISNLMGMEELHIRCFSTSQVMKIFIFTL